MAMRNEQILRALGNVLIDLEFHAATVRSWASWEEYANAASTASFVNEGYSLRMVSIDMSAARQSNATETMIRVPLKQGLPWQTLGSTAIWSLQFIASFYRANTPLATLGTSDASARGPLILAAEKGAEPFTYHEGHEEHEVFAPRHSSCPSCSSWLIPIHREHSLPHSSPGNVGSSNFINTLSIAMFALRCAISKV